MTTTFQQASKAAEALSEVGQTMPPDADASLVYRILSASALTKPQIAELKGPMKELHEAVVATANSKLFAGRARAMINQEFGGLVRVAAAQVKGEQDPATGKRIIPLDVVRGLAQRTLSFTSIIFGPPQGEASPTEPVQTPEE